ncbi:MAG: hypothetical protein IJ043_10235 [Clostridia bacterium]|nr:hypothetical protein [Clostridia bacterium]
MSKHEKTRGNKVAASLYVGVGGIGSKIIREVCDLAKNDDLTKARFVILDTDVNDLSKSEDGINITSIQTSSPRTIRDYLLQDEDARNEWFPNNMIINGKTVSEGAGQVRAISRLALNATIKTGRIKALYRAIDELYNKDGSDKRQTVKVIVASTVAGGTGSGIAMIVAMLIRNYIAERYPDSSAIIRGFLVMPGVMDTFGPATSEQLSLQRNGYATIKEINAFMMRPFFEAVPELRRYMDLHVDVPNPAGGTDSLRCTPFDFCFLFDRTDENVCNMSQMSQYRSYVAHSIYEQCIGPMSAKASSKEDNIHREFLDDKKLSRNRFGGAGASVLRYPYEQIRDYIAFDWIEKALIGYSSKDVDEAGREKMVTESWLIYDKDFRNKEKAFLDNPHSTEKAPDRATVYMADVETGSERFTTRLVEDHIDPKNAKHKNALAAADDQAFGSTSIAAVEHYIQQMVLRAYELCEQGAEETREGFDNYKSNSATGKKFKVRYRNINKALDFVDPARIKKTVRSFVDRAFNGNEQINAGNEPYMMEAFLSLDGKALHPNAMRYLLYKLMDQLAVETKNEPEYAIFEQEIATIKRGPMKVDSKKGDQRDISGFQVLGNGTETGLESMCNSCAESSLASEDAKLRCNKKLDNFAVTVEEWYEKFVRYYVCQEAKPFVERLIAQFEGFYDKFETKVVGLEKRKKTVLSKIAFKPGNCEYNLFNNPEHLNKLVEEQTMPSGGTRQESDLFAGIYGAIKENAKKAERLRHDSFADETLDDVFETVIIEQYKKIVEEWCGDYIDVDIVRACGMEHRIKCLCMAEKDPQKEEELRKLASDPKAKNAHMAKLIEMGRAFASPSIIRKDFEESRTVNAMAYNIYMEEGDGMQMPEEYFVADNASDTVSKYELRFFRSVYNITPIQLQKLCSPQADPGKLNECVDSGEAGMVGIYFTAYQDYMAKIGPDNRLNPVITPHIDKRWNSITVLPELDPQGYQRVLMKRIHKAMLYGFIFQLIEKRMSSVHDPNKLVYEYIDGRNGTKKFIVSNHTKCDRLFEVLDSLYFDRYAVHSIHGVADKKRKKEFEASTLYEETTFARYLPEMDRMMLVDSMDRRALAAEKLQDKQVSLFEIPLLYWNSLPKKDAAELEIMVDAIFEIIELEISTFVDADDANPLIAKTIRDHYNMLYENYNLCPAVYTGSDRIGIKENPAVKVIRKKVLEKIDDLDVSGGEDFGLVDQTKRDALFV